MQENYTQLQMSHCSYHTFSHIINNVTLYTVLSTTLLMFPFCLLTLYTLLNNLLTLHTITVYPTVYHWLAYILLTHTLFTHYYTIYLNNLQYYTIIFKQHPPL